MTLSKTKNIVSKMNIMKTKVRKNGQRKLNECVRAN